MTDLPEIVRISQAHGAASIYACDKTATPSTFSLLTASLATSAPNTKLIPYPFDVTSEEETLALIDEILAAFGRLDVWVSSSSLLGPASIHDTTADSVHACLAAHSLAPLFALKHAPPAMAKLLTTKRGYPNAAPKTQKYGSIIVVGSVASTYGGCWGPAYTVSAHAALGVVRAGVAVLKGTGVRINAIAAGQIDVGIDLKGMDMRGMSDQFPPARLQERSAIETSIGLERAGRPQEVARVAGFLASGFSSYVTGANLVVDGEYHPPTTPCTSSPLLAPLLTPLEFTILHTLSVAAKSTSYSPYSSFRVGCALLTSSGEYITGANVENASYPVTTCAERVAFCTAIVQGHRGFKAVAVATDTDRPASPCGMCRQCIREFCDLGIPVVMFDGAGGWSVATLEQLLPMSFGPEALGVTAQTGTAVAEKKE
ncbi:putative cytidine deaminase [Echria macrotheca]|uniref:cytidine deaminase n=1 Tax=Echria macrotheca TaxID=438768 RepID=A0AAJ0BAK2_9PEZI|nr:putative cytidine deaminase [Echria macrotheca]